MKINRQKLHVGLVSLLCLSLPQVSAWAADENDAGTGKKIDGSAYQAPSEQQQSSSDQQQSSSYQNTSASSASSAAAPGAPAAVNKASSLVGMEVRNASNERLGKIKDLVIDTQSGKVSYAVLDGGTILQSKMFAVPLNAFTVAADQKSLVLNTDKSRIQAAQGFDKNSWPSVNNPDWGANTFWEQPSGSQPATTTPNQSRSGEMPRSTQ